MLVALIPCQALRFHMMLWWRVNSPENNHPGVEVPFTFCGVFGFGSDLDER